MLNKEHCQSFLRKKNTKSVKQSKLINQKPKTFEKPSIADLKSVRKEHQKTSYKLSKTRRQAEKIFRVGLNSSLYGDTKKMKFT